jgi:hypothetical protein
MTHWETFEETVELEPLCGDGFVVDVSGEITYRSAGAQLRVTSGMVIRPGCFISMKAGSQLAIRTADGAVSQLESETGQARNISFVPGNPATFIDDYISSAGERLPAALSALEAAASRGGAEFEQVWRAAIVRSIPADEARRLFDPAAATVLAPATCRKYMVVSLKPPRAGIVSVVSDLWTIEKYLMIAREIGKPIAPLACEHTTVAELLQAVSP